MLIVASRLINYHARVTPPVSIDKKFMDQQKLRQTLTFLLETDRMFGLNSVAIPPDDIRQMLKQSKPVAQASLAIANTTRSQVTQVGETAASLDDLNGNHVKGCRKCTLCDSRTQTVFGQGNPNADLVFVGEAPGYEEDKQGLAFVGRAGQLLTKMIAAMKLSRDDVYICNVLKCRPPNNRDPSAEEILQCSPYLFEQLRLIQPKVLVALGAPAAKTLLRTTQSIGKLRGRWHEFTFPDDDNNSISLMPTYHPAYLLRNNNEKAKAWHDLQMVMQKLDID